MTTSVIPNDARIILQKGMIFGDREFANRCRNSDTQFFASRFAAYNLGGSIIVGAKRIAFATAHLYKHSQHKKAIEAFRDEHKSINREATDLSPELQEAVRHWDCRAVEEQDRLLKLQIIRGVFEIVLPILASLVLTLKDYFYETKNTYVNNLYDQENNIYLGITGNSLNNQINLAGENQLRQLRHWEMAIGSYLNQRKGEEQQANNNDVNQVVA